MYNSTVLSPTHFPMLKYLLIILDLLLVGTVYLITNYQEIIPVIMSYKKQSFIVAGSIALTIVIESKMPSTIKQVVLICFAVLLPISLGLFIEWFLRRATIFAVKDAKLHRETARRIWRSQKIANPSERRKLGVDVLLIILLVISTVIPFEIIHNNREEIYQSFDKFIFLFLYLAGLYNTTQKRDIISQTIGILTIDHGLYLAIFKFVDTPVLIIWFVVSLYAYTLITLVMLWIIIPRVRRESGSLDLTEIANQSSLEG